MRSACDLMLSIVWAPPARKYGTGLLLHRWTYPPGDFPSEQLPPTCPVVRSYLIIIQQVQSAAHFFLFCFKFSWLLFCVFGLLSRVRGHSASHQMYFLEAFQNLCTKITWWRGKRKVSVVKRSDRENSLNSEAWWKVKLSINPQVLQSLLTIAGMSLLEHRALRNSVEWGPAETFSYPSKRSNDQLSPPPVCRALTLLEVVGGGRDRK